MTKTNEYENMTKEQAIELIIKIAFDKHINHDELDKAYMVKQMDLINEANDFYRNKA